MFDYEDIYLEGYYDAIDFLNEASSTAKYLNHHSIGGTLFGPGLFRWFNSELKKGDSKMGVAKLYPKYVKYCEKHDYTPLPKNEFIIEGKKYYELKAKIDLGQFGMDTLGRGLSVVGNSMSATGAVPGAVVGSAMIGVGNVMHTAGAIGSEFYRRSNSFIDKAGMKHDLDY